MKERTVSTETRGVQPHLLLPAASTFPEEVRRREQSEPQQTAATLCPRERDKEGGRDTRWGMEKLS